MKKIFKKFLGPISKNQETTDLERLRRYVLVDETSEVLRVFYRLRGMILNGFEGGDPLWDRQTCRIERGFVGKDRPYLYLAPWHAQGWLFECSLHGWVISQAEKIVSQDTFVRTSQAWEVVTLFKAEGQTVADGFRISSSRHEGQLLSFPIYESELRGSLDLQMGDL